MLNCHGNKLRQIERERAWAAMQIRLAATQIGRDDVTTGIEEIMGEHGIGHCAEGTPNQDKRISKSHA